MNEEKRRNNKRENSITPDITAPKGIPKALKLDEGGEDMGKGEASELYTPIGPQISKEVVKSNLFGVEIEGGKVQAKLDKCRKCDGRLVCVLEPEEESLGENIKCQVCWMQEVGEWEEKMKEKEEEECKQCEEKQRKIEEMEDKIDMEGMGRTLGQSQATQGVCCKECAEKEERINDLEGQINEFEEGGGRQCEECEENRAKISEYEQRLRQEEEDSDRSSNNMEVDDEEREMQSRIARLDAEVEALKKKMEEANEEIKERKEVIESMAVEVVRHKNEKDEFEEKWQTLKGRMEKIVEYCREGGNNNEEVITEEIREVPREKIIIVGSSHMTFIRNNMDLKDEDIVSATSGAGIKEIMGKAVKQAKEAKGKAVLFICGGGE